MSTFDGNEGKQSKNEERKTTLASTKVLGATLLTELYFLQQFLGINCYERLYSYTQKILVSVHNSTGIWKVTKAIFLFLGYHDLQYDFVNTFIPDIIQQNSKI